VLAEKPSVHWSDYPDRKASLLANLADETVLQALADLRVPSWEVPDSGI
jgi:hypothetical protein